MNAPAERMEVPADADIVTYANADLTETIKVFEQYGVRLLSPDEIRAEMPQSPLEPFSMIRRIIGEGTGYGPGAYLGLKHFSERRDHARKPKTHHRGSAHRPCSSQGRRTRSRADVLLPRAGA